MNRIQAFSCLVSLKSILKQSHFTFQTKEDEIAFLTTMYEEKVKALMSIDLGSDAFASAFSNELALALRDIRGEYEAIMEATRTQVG